MTENEKPNTPESSGNEAAGEENTLHPLQALVAENQVVEALRTCFDPEIPVNIYEMGLIYGIRLEPSGEVEIQMTLTSPNCPAAQSLPQDVESKVRAIPGVKEVKVEVVWEPTWNPEMMSEAARLQLGFF